MCMQTQHVQCTYSTTHAYATSYIARKYIPYLFCIVCSPVASVFQDGPGNISIVHIHLTAIHLQVHYTCKQWRSGRDTYTQPFWNILYTYALQPNPNICQLSAFSSIIHVLYTYMTKFTTTDSWFTFYGKIITFPSISCQLSFS